MHSSCIVHVVMFSQAAQEVKDVIQTVSPRVVVLELDQVSNCSTLLIAWSLQLLTQVVHKWC